VVPNFQIPSQTLPLSEVLNFTNIPLTPMPIWSRSRGIGKRSHTPFIPSNVEYTLQKSPHPQLANEETLFYLIPAKNFPMPANNQVRHLFFLYFEANNNNCLCKLQNFGNPVPMCANVIHTSGTVNCAEVQKLDGFPGYRCSFIPPKSGKYSAQLYYNVWKQSNGNSDMTGMELGTMVCEPLEFSVSRNYPKDARNLLSSSTIKLADNGEKYWGITCDNYTGRVSKIFLIFIILFLLIISIFAVLCFRPEFWRNNFSGSSYWTRDFTFRPKWG
jgi:hypothetical protein